MILCWIIGHVPAYRIRMWSQEFWCTPSTMNALRQLALAHSTSALPTWSGQIGNYTGAPIDGPLCRRCKRRLKTSAR